LCDTNGQIRQFAVALLVRVGNPPHTPMPSHAGSTQCPPPCPDQEPHIMPPFADHPRQLRRKGQQHFLRCISDDFDDQLRLPALEWHWPAIPDAPTPVFPGATDIRPVRVLTAGPYNRALERLSSLILHLD